MGSPLSVIIAILVMKTVENKALTHCSVIPSFWCRYVDNTFMIIHKNNMEMFHAFIDNIENSIKFTVETEVDGSFSFFEVLVTLENSAKLRTASYRKPTHTTRYPNYNSNHILAKKLA